MKFAHIADTHIRNLKYHYEYRIIFDKMYEALREEEVDCIIHCGDLAHTKTQLSPEYFEMATNFLRSLADIAPTYIIPGNHDGNLKNSNRQDAITPIIDALEHPNLHLLKDSGETELGDNFTINVLSVFDTENWQDPSDSTKVNIALHHGSISGCKTDLNWTMQHGENDISIFDAFDYAFLGDIHKTNQILDEHGRIRYCGSTVQQNHGETNDKGLLVWDVTDKENFTCKHIAILNPRPFITLELTPKGRLPRKKKVPEGARLRIAARNKIPLDVLRKTMDAAKYKFKPESITFLNRAAGERGSVEDLTKAFMKEDLRDVAIQEKFIKEYLKDHEPDEDTLQRVFDFNKKYNDIIHQDEEVHRNVNWKLTSLEWDNLFNYGEKNKIDFEKLNGIVGIFGKNYSGKSSVVDSLLYTLYNTTSKNSRKNLHVINQNKDACLGRLNIAVNNKTYTIERKSEKYEKTLHGETTQEAKTDVDFFRKCEVSGDDESLNGLSRNDTDKNIRKIFGTLEDFLLTSMSSQIESLSFIKEGSTKRKEILAKFIDLEVFDKKFKLAKEDATDLRGALKRLEERDFDEELDLAVQELEDNAVMIADQKSSCEKIKRKIRAKEKQLQKLQSKISSIPTEIIDINEIKELLDNKRAFVNTLEEENTDNSTYIESQNGFLKKVEGFKDSFDINELMNKKEILSQKKHELELIVNGIEVENNRKSGLENRVKLLDEVPCGPEYSHCKFIKNAYEAQEDINLVQIAIGRLKEQKYEIDNEIVALDSDKLDEYIEKYKKLIEKETEIRAKIGQKTLNTEKNNNQMLSLNLEIEKLDEKVVEYNNNKEAIENLESLLSKEISIKDEIAENNEKLEKCENNLLELYKSHGFCEQQLQSLKDSKEELEKLRQDYSAYDLFMRCMHSNGIPYDIIKKKLPEINEEIAKILTNIVNFEVFFQAKEKKLEIFIKHPKYEPRPIELGSGAEKTIAAMALRLALLGVSNLPKPDLFILDEPGTALDEENMEGFVRILTDMIKASFKTVLLISHLDSLKDCVDSTIEIERNGNLAYINQ